MSYESITIKKEFIIDNIYFIHHFEQISDFLPQRQSNHFWKLLYVDKGSVNIIRDGVNHSLHKDNIVFFQPDEYLNICANGTIATSLLIIGFDCKSDVMDFFENNILEINPASRTLLTNIIREAQLTYSNDLDNIDDKKLKRREKKSIPFASEQMIQIYLKLLLIRLIRDNDSDSPLVAIPKSPRQISEDDLFYKIIDYMEENISEKLTIQKICKDNLIGRSLLQKLFKEHTSCGTIDYFTNMKIIMAKQLIRENKINFSQIAEKLGYSSIHYFSRQFKNITGTTLTEYQESIISSTEKPAK